VDSFAHFSGENNIGKWSGHVRPTRLGPIL
jgi:hypothetical protein